MTAIAVGEGVLALNRFLRKLRRDRMDAEGAMEIRKPDGETVMYKPEEGAEDNAMDAAPGNAKPHQDRPSQMGLAG